MLIKETQGFNTYVYCISYLYHDVTGSAAYPPGAQLDQIDELSMKTLLSVNFPWQMSVMVSEQINTRSFP